MWPWLREFVYLWGEGSEHQAVASPALCRLCFVTHAVWKPLTFVGMAPLHNLLSPYGAGVPSPVERAAEAWGDFNWSSGGVSG